MPEGDMMRKLWNQTIWSKHGVPVEAWRFRGIFRFVLPITDVFFAWFGIVGVITGIGSVQDAAGWVWQTWWSAGIGVSAIAALIGVAFPRLWALELGAKLILVGLVSAYVILYISRGLDNPNITALAGLIVILILLPIWRLTDLARDVYRKGLRG